MNSNRKIAQSSNRQWAYKQAYRDKTAMLATHDLLLLVGYDVPYPAIETWSRRMRDKAEDHAAREHLHASGHHLMRAPCPAFLEQWQVASDQLSGDRAIG